MKQTNLDIYGHAPLEGPRAERALLPEPPGYLPALRLARGQPSQPLQLQLWEEEEQRQAAGAVLPDRKEQSESVSFPSLRSCRICAILNTGAS